MSKSPHSPRTSLQGVDKSNAEISYPILVQDKIAKMKQRSEWEQSKDDIEVAQSPVLEEREENEVKFMIKLIH